MIEYQIGKIVKGVVCGIEPYGIFVQFDEYYSGLIHISEVSHNFVRNLNYYVSIGDTIYTKIIGIDANQKRLKLSIKDVAYRGTNKRKRLKIIETKTGFDTLKQMLPYWIDENLQNMKNKINSIDK